MAALGVHLLWRHVATQPIVAPWTLGFGGAGYESGARVKIHGDSVTVAGIFTSTFQLGGQSFGRQSQENDVFVASLGLDGTPRWTKTFDDSDYQTVARLALDLRGNVFVVRDSQVAKLGRDGELLWNRSFDNTRLVGVAVDARGSVVLAGSYRERSAQGTRAVEDVVVMKLDGAGNDLWTKRFGDPLHQSVSALDGDDKGNIVLAGNFAGDLELGEIRLHSEGTNLLASDTFLALLDGSGVSRWAVMVPFTVRSLAVGPAGTIAVVGFKFPGRDITENNPLRRAIVAQFDSQGQMLWEREFDAGVRLNGVEVARDGSVVAVGGFEGSVRFEALELTTAGDQDIFVLRLDEGGSVNAAERFGGPTPDYGIGLATDAVGNVVVTGAHSGQVDFATGSVVGHGDSDVFVTSFSLSGSTAAASSTEDSARTTRNGWTESYRAGFSAIAVDAGANLAVSGVFAGDLVWGEERHQGRGHADVLVAKLDPRGRRIWTRAFGDEQVQSLPSLSVDGVGSVILGFEDRPYDVGWKAMHQVNGRSLLKLSSSGEEIWRFAYRDYGSHAPAFAATGEGTVVLARSSEGGSELVGLDERGKETWNRSLDTDRFLRPHGLALGQDGDVAIVGQTGRQEGTSFLLVTDARGNERWSHEFGSNHWPTELRIAFAASGEVLIGGRTLGDLTLAGRTLPGNGGTEAESFLAKFDPSGNLGWAQRFPGKSRLNGLLFRSDGSAVGVGSFEGQVSFGTLQLRSVGSMDAFVVEIDTRGVVRNARRFGGSEPDVVYAVAEGSDGSLILSGSSGGSIELPGGVATGSFIALFKM